MVNLLNETIDFLKRYEKTLLDVEWIGNDEFTISMSDFCRLANVEYDEGFGYQNVASDLVLVGKDFYLERIEYDGEENWEFKMIPDKPMEQRTIQSLISKTGWETLSEINE